METNKKRSLIESIGFALIDLGKYLIKSYSDVELSSSDLFQGKKYLYDTTNIGIHDGKIFRVKLNGGIIGAFTSNPKAKLDNKFKELNDSGYRVVQVIDDSTGNLLIYLVRIILLVLTIFLWTVSNGYFIITEKIE